MREYMYKVIFTNGLSAEVLAFGEPTAKILAQAEMIKRGNSYDVERMFIID